MKRIFLFLFLMSICVCTCFAESYEDDFISTQNSDSASYQNLVARSQDSVDDFNWPEAADQTFCSLPSSRSVGSVTYQIQGARTLEVALYSRAGTFATENAALDSFVLGYFSRVDPSLKRLEPLVSPSTGGLYVMSDKGLLQLTGTSLAKMFILTNQQPDDLLPYGLQVYAGKDSHSLRLISGSRDRSKETQQFRSNRVIQYYDVFRFNLPADAQIVRIVLRDYTVFPMEDGSIRNNSVRNPLRLAKAVFSGESIHVGPPDESSSSNPSSSSTPSSSDPSSSSPGGGAWEEDPDLESVPDNGSSSEKGKEPVSSSSSSPSAAPSSSSSSNKPSSSSKNSSKQTSPSSTPLSKPTSNSSNISSSVASSQVLGGEQAENSSSGKSGLYLILAVYLAAGAAGLLLLLEKKHKSSDSSSEK